MAATGDGVKDTTTSYPHKRGKVLRSDRLRLRDTFNLDASPKMESNKRQKLEDLNGLTSKDKEVVEWLTEHGAGLKDLRWHRGPMGFSVAAGRDLSAGEVVATLPNDLVLTVERAWDTPIGKILREAGFECSDEMMLWVHMASEKGKAGKWGPYLSALPDTVSIPTTWEDTFLQEQLGGTTLYAQVKKERATIDQEFEEVQTILEKHGSKLELSDVLWAVSMFRSRSFPSSLVEGGSRRPCMLPLLDMFNHRRGEPIDWNHGPCGVQFKLGLAKAAGEELFNNYGARSNSELLFSYGFCTYPNPDDTVIVNLGCRVPDPAAVERKTVLLRGLELPFTVNADGLSLSIGPFEISGEEAGGVPELMFTAMAVCMMEEEDEEDGGGEVEVTLDAVEELLKLVQQKQAGIPSTEEEDARVIAEGGQEGEQGGVGRYVSMYRQGQRDVLKAAEKMLEAMLAEGEGGEGGEGGEEGEEEEEEEEEEVGDEGESEAGTGQSDGGGPEKK